MRPKFLAVLAGMVALGALFVASLPVSAQEPTPMTGAVAADSGCCNPCARHCKPACPPCVEYKGCASPCGVEKIVTVCKPCGCTQQVTIKLPAGCEKAHTYSNGNQVYHSSGSGVHITWLNGGSKLVVRYHG